MEINTFRQIFKALMSPRLRISKTFILKPSSTFSGEIYFCYVEIKSKHAYQVDFFESLFMRAGNFRYLVFHTSSYTSGKQMVVTFYFYVCDMSSFDEKTRRQFASQCFSYEQSFLDLAYCCLLSSSYLLNHQSSSFMMLSVVFGSIAIVFFCPIDRCLFLRRY